MYFIHFTFSSGKDTIHLEHIFILMYSRLFHCTHQRNVWITFPQEGRKILLLQHGLKQRNN